MRKKFSVMYPSDHHDQSLAGTKYKCSGKDMLVMNNEGVFFIFNGERYYPSIRLLSDILHKYDVVWH